MFTFHSVLCLQAITSNIQQHLQKKQTFKEGKYQLVLQRVTDSYRQSQASCDKVLIICWAGKEIPASFPELCIFLFNRPGTREIFFFPLSSEMAGMENCPQLGNCISYTEGMDTGLVLASALLSPPLLKKDHSSPVSARISSLVPSSGTSEQQNELNCILASQNPHVSIFTKG